MIHTSYRRADHDFYPTPPEATRALLSVETFDGPIWEPASGNGAIAKVLMAAGHRVISTDLIDRGWGTGGIDFLAETRNRARHIVTNPPYAGNLISRFAQHALNLARPVRGTVVMLVDFAGLAHPSRTGFYVRNPPAAIYALDELVCWPNGIPNPAIPAHNRFCWVVWKPDHTGRPTFWWLNTERFRRSESKP